MNKLQAALHYCEKGFSVIPIRPDKKPFIQWVDFQKRRATAEEIRAWWAKWPMANVGIVTGEISGLLVIDCDNEEAYQKIQELLPDSFITCIAKTPRGYHLYLVYPRGQSIGNAAGIIAGVDVRGTGGYIIAPPSINAEGKSYSWMQGMSIDEVAPAAVPDAILINTSIKGRGYRGGEEPPQTTNNHNDHKRPQMFVLGTRDNDLFHTANCLVKGGMPDEEIGQVLERIILSWGENPDKKWIEAKIKSAIDRAERRQKNWTEEVRDYITTTDGYITTTDCHKQLQATTSDHKKAINMALLRMKEAGIIEKYGEKSGTYKKVEQLEESIIDLAAADNTSLPIKFPFGIHELVKIMPKNIIIVAGESNAGKSAFLLNVAARNMIDHKVVYFSSEMGGAELKERLQNFNEKMPFKMWEKCTFIERANDFDMAIRPNDINIIDFLEIHDEFL